MPETQTLDLSGLVPQTAKYEVQVVEVLPVTEDYISDYRLGVAGVYTGMIYGLYTGKMYGVYTGMMYGVNI